MTGSIQLYLTNVLIGDPLNSPVLKASTNVPSDHIVYGKDLNHGGTVNFYISIKNIVIDSTKLSPSIAITLLDWTVSQAARLTNVVFNMPSYSSGHVGPATNYDSKSNVVMKDRTFYGRAVGMKLSSQQ